MNRCLIPILICIISLPAIGEELYAVNVPKYDSLLVNHQYDVLLNKLEVEGVDSTTSKKYSSLIREIKFIPKYSSNELIGISESGLNYVSVFTVYQAGKVASKCFGLYLQNHEDQNYEDAVKWFKIAFSHRASYLLNLSKHVNQSLEDAQELVKSGNYSQAYDILSPLEKDIYSISKLSEYREVYDIRFTKLKFVRDERTKKIFLNEKRYSPSIRYEIDFKIGTLLWGKSYIGERSIYYQYSNSSDLRIPYHITKFEASAGYNYGFGINKNISPSTQILLSFASRTIKYIAYNEISGWNTEFSFRNTEFGMGVRYTAPTEGRLRYWTSIQHATVKMNPIEKEEDTPGSLESNRYYISFDKMRDTQIEFDIGVTMFLQSNWPLTIQPHLKYIVSTTTPNDNSSNQLLAVLSIGTYF